MKDKDIIKALECISGQAPPDFDCGDCRIERSKYTTCEVFATEHALELIKKQQAEIERLQNILDEKVIDFAYNKKQEIKTEAYKEFADKLNDNAVWLENHKVIFKIYVDKTLEELTERKED